MLRASSFLSRLLSWHAIVFGIAISVGFAGCVQAADVRLSQLAHKSWRISDGSLPYSPNVIAQTSDGYIWIATDVDLLRFDGVRFVAFQAPGSEAINQIVSLFADGDGSLWVGSRSGIFHLHDGKFTALKHRIRANQFVQTTNGEIWFASSGRDVNGSQGPLCHIVSDDYLCIDVGGHQPSGATIAWDGSDGFWISLVQQGLCHWTTSTTNCTSPDKAEPWADDVSIITRSASGDIWFGAKPKGQVPRLFRWSNGAFGDPISLPQADTTTTLQAIAADADGSLWIGTSNSGLYRVKDRSLEHLSATDGLTSNVIGDAMLDLEGSMWTVSSEGIDHFYSRPIETWSMRQGLTADSVSSIAVDSTGRVYFGNEGALDILDGDSIRSVKAGQGLPGQTVQGMIVDRHDMLWIGVDTAFWTFDGNAFSPVTLPYTEPGSVMVLSESAQDEIWFRNGRERYVVKSRRAELVKSGPYSSSGQMAADPERGVWACAKGVPPAHFFDDQMQVEGQSPNANALTFPPVLVFGGFVWCATSDGFVAWKNGEHRTLGKENGLLMKRVYAATLDLHGNLWMMTERSYVKISKSDIDAWIADGQAKIHPQEYGAEDGAHTGLSTFGLSVQLAPNGDIWFATDRFAQRIRPDNLALNTKPPSVVVESVLADGKSSSLGESIKIPPLTHTLEVDYTALSFINPERIAFRYRLDGVDAGWQDAGARRQALYTDLSPGTYLFHVSATNSDGTAATQEAALSFVMQPAFYQTWWFRTLIAIATLAVLIATYRQRKAHIIRRVQTRLFDRLAERELIARDLHDTFFQGIQGLLLRFHTGVSTLKRDDPARSVFEEALEQSDRVMLEGRELVLDLRERLDDAKPLADVLRAIGEDLTSLHGSRFALEVIGTPMTFKPLVREELFRIGKEAMINAFRHGNALLVSVELRYEPLLFSMSIVDDGQGVDASILQRGRRAGHWGLPGMRERTERIDGTFSVRSQTGEGSQITITVPGKTAYARDSRRVRRTRATH